MHLFPLKIESNWVTELAICAQIMITANHQDALGEIYINRSDSTVIRATVQIRKDLICNVIPVSSA